MCGARTVTDCGTSRPDTQEAVSPAVRVFPLPELYEYMDEVNKIKSESVPVPSFTHLFHGTSSSMIVCMCVCVK